jgi:deoxycytidine triphosphate deaminase
VRLGDQVSVSAAAQAPREGKKTFEIRRIAKGESVELLPGDTALLYSIEHLSIPANVIGLTVARGLLFAESLCPENTYVDPGFTGSLYTTVTNVSNRAVHLDYGMPLARLFFFRLAEAVGNPYQSGAALGISQQLKTIRATTLTTLEEYQRASTQQLLAEIERLPVHGPHIRQALLRQSTQALRLYLLAVFWPIVLIVANSSSVKEQVGPFIANVIASIVGSIVVLGLPWLIKQVRGQ